MINVFETSFEARERRFQIEKLYHGETVDLVGVVTTDGVLKNITGYSVQGVFQPTTAQGSDQFYELSADIVDNKVVVHWEKGKDFGEPSYMVWALLTDGDDASYPIAWRLDMAYSPNFPLSALDPIPKTIDFSKYELLNAPWAMLSDFQDLQEDVSELSDGLSAYAKKEDIPEVEGKYLPLSGGTVTGALSVDGTFESSNFKGDAGTGIMIGYNAKAKAGSIAIGSSSDVTNAHYFGSNVAIGTSAKIGASSETDCGVAIGIGATVNGNHGIAIGHAADAEGDNSIAIGSSGSRVQAVAPESIQIGGLSNGLWTPNNTPHSLKVFDKMVLSGDNLTLDPERVPYLSGYAKKEDIPEVPTDLSAFTNSPGYLTAHQSLSDYYTKEEADGKFLTAHQDLTDYATKEYVQSEISDFVTEDALTGLATKEEVQAVDDKLSDYAEKEELTAYAQLSDVPVLPDDLVHEDELSDYAQLSDIPELPEDIVRKDDLSVYAQLSDLENIDIDGMSACLSSDEFADVEELGAAETVSFQDLVDKVNLVIQKLKRTWKDPKKTYFSYSDGTEIGLNLTGTIERADVPNRAELTGAIIGTTVTGIGSQAFRRVENTGIDSSKLTYVYVPSSVTSIGYQAFSYAFRQPSTIVIDGNGLTTIDTEAFEECSGLSEVRIPSSVTTLKVVALGGANDISWIFEGRTMAEVQSMQRFRWSAGTNKIICTDGTL